MSFEDKMDKMKPVLTNYKEIDLEYHELRISKSYTLKRHLAEELIKEAKKRDLTASRYLENILKREFGE